MKILITGARGMLGNDLSGKLTGYCELVRKDIDDCDICDPAAVHKLIGQSKPDLVINCAAFTDVDGAETNPHQAFAINAHGVRNLALACKESGSLLYHISTDFVFDGKKNTPYAEIDPTCPLSVYGKSKLEGEEHIKNILAKYVIIRTSWLFGKNGKNFVSTIKRLSGEKDELRVVNDQCGCPTYTVDLADAIKKLLALPAQGIYHVCNCGACTWYEFAVQIVRASGLSTRITPIPSRELTRPAARPGYSVMDCGKFITESGMHLRTWEDALEAYLET